jgi:arylsulfatase A-like enzyme
MSDRPNVLMVLTDQQRWDTLGAYGNPMGLTPNLDRMAEDGVLLEHLFSPQPVCTPARACIQTGQYGTTHGVFGNGKTPLPHTEDALARVFGRNGYQTGYVGKWHLADKDPVPSHQRGGYDDFWLAANGLEMTSHPYEGLLYDEEGRPTYFDGYRVDALTDMAIDFLRTERDDPFFLFLSYLEPHHQNDMETYVAPEGYAERYQNPYVPPDLQGTEGDWYAELPDYYGICARIDECVGRLLAELEAQDIDKDTIVLFTSDHGCHFRTRNGEYKRSCHESSIRVPGVVRGPGFEDGETIEELVNLIDIPPTLLDAVGIDPPAAMQGESIVPLVEGDQEWINEVLIQVSETAVERAIRTTRWKYGVYAPDRDPLDNSDSDVYVERYLYDLQRDPGERNNLIGRAEPGPGDPDPRQSEIRAVADDLRDRLVDLMADAGEGEVIIEPPTYEAPGRPYEFI